MFAVFTVLAFMCMCDARNVYVEYDPRKCNRHSEMHDTMHSTL